MARKRKKKAKRSSRKKVKPVSRRIRKPTKKSDAKKILVVVIIAIVLLQFVLYMFSILNQEQQTSINGGQTSQDVILENTYGGPCKTNTECYSVSCKIDDSKVECVNVEAMIDYHRNCGAYWDVNVRTQPASFSVCACVDGYCRKP